MYLNHEEFRVTGVTVDAISAEDKTISLFGPRKVLDQIKEFSVDVDVSEVKGQGTMAIDLKKPKGVSKMSLDKVKVKIDATVTDVRLGSNSIQNHLVEERKS